MRENLRARLSDCVDRVPNMDASEYKTQTNQPGTLRRPDLEETARVISHTEPKLADELLRQLGNVPLRKPELHIDANNADWLRVHLDGHQIEQIIDCLAIAEAAAVSEDGDTTSETSRLADLLDTWQRLFGHPN